MLTAALLAGVALAAPAAAAPVRTCAQRAETGAPQAFRAPGPGSARLGPLYFANLDRMKALTASELSRTSGRLPFHKTGVILKAGTVVTLTIAPRSRAF